MRQEISSRYTYMYRWVVPGFLTLVAIGAIWEFGNLGRPEPADSSRVLVGVAIAVITILLARILDRAKKVWIEDDHLIISDFRTEIKVALADVAEVGALSGFWPVRVVMHFRRPTVFGSKVRFFPPLRLAGPARVVRRVESELRSHTPE